MTPQGNMNFRPEHLENKKGEAIEVAPATAMWSGCRFLKK